MGGEGQMAEGEKRKTMSRNKVSMYVWLFYKRLFRRCVVEQCFSNLFRHKNHAGIYFKMRMPIQFIWEVCYYTLVRLYQVTPILLVLEHC